MKKILTILIVLITFFSQFNLISANVCKFDKWENAKVTDMIDGCMQDTTVVAVKDDWDIEDGFKKKVQGWTNNIALFLWLLSIGAIIYWGLMMTLSTWEDEKIKKAKDIVKWSLLWLLWVILATTIVTLIINVMYGLSVASTK
jgi:hypothetical protein